MDSKRAGKEILAPDEVLMRGGKADALRAAKMVLEEGGKVEDMDAALTLWLREEGTDPHF